MIGVLDMENESYQRAKLFSWVFYPILIGLAIIQVSSFLLYNGRYHPMAKILDGANKNEGAHYYYHVYISCSRHRTNKFTNSESPIFTTKFLL